MLLPRKMAKLYITSFVILCDKSQGTRGSCLSAHVAQLMNMQIKNAIGSPGHPDRSRNAT